MIASNISFSRRDAEMRRTWIAFILLMGFVPVSQLQAKDAEPQTYSSLAENFGKLPLSFEANNGQVDSSAKFLSRGNGYTLFLTSNETILSLRRGSFKEEEQKSGKVPVNEEYRQVASSVVRLKFIEANPNSKITGLDELPGKSNYFIGNDPEKWHRNIKTYKKVRFQDLYPGIDIVYYGNQRQLEYDFVVSPGADPSAILLSIEGAQNVDIDKQGNLIMELAEGISIRFRRPTTYQTINSTREEIASRYVLKETASTDGTAVQVAFDLAPYDPGQALIIDPELEYSTYLGGNLDDDVEDIAVDQAGNVYLTGRTTSADFPTTDGAFHDFLAFCLGDCGDAFVTKLDPSVSTLVYSTYLGGTIGIAPYMSTGDDGGKAIAVDGEGNAYVTGSTASYNFPITSDPFQQQLKPRQYVSSTPAYTYTRDAFVTKLNATGSDLIYSTFIGGSGEDRAYDIDIDDAGHAYITGEAGYLPTSCSPTPCYYYQYPYPTTVGAFQEEADIHSKNAFVTGFNTTGSGLVYSTFLGGQRDDYGHSLKVDSSGRAFVIGETESADFPTTEGVLDATCGSDGNCDYSGTYYRSDVFVTKLNPYGSALEYSTYLGGSKDEYCGGIALNSNGDAFIAGTTFSDDFPTTPDSYQTEFNVYKDAFVGKLNPTASALIYATFLGGSFWDEAKDIALDSSGNVILAGGTASGDFPTTTDAYQSISPPSSNAFVAALNEDISRLLYSTYMGGGSIDYAESLALDSSDNIYVTGHTYSADFPTTDGALDNTCGTDDPCDLSNRDVFTLMLSPVVSQRAANDVIFDFGTGTGIWGRYNDTTWTRLHSLSPESITAGDLDGNGQDEVIIDFGSGVGIWIQNNNAAWARLHIMSPEIIATGDLDGNGEDEVIIDFGPGTGLWVRYNNFTWTKLHSLSPEIITTGDLDGNGEDDCIMDFGPGIGVYVFYNNSTWTKLHSLSPEIMSTGDLDGNGQDDCIMDFGSGIGTYVRYNNTTWTRIHSLSPEIIATGDLDGNGKDDCIIDFGPGTGLWIRYNDATWTRLHNLSPEIISVGDLDSNGQDDAIIDFGSGIGTYVRYNNATWTKIHSLSPESITTGNMDNN